MKAYLERSRESLSPDEKAWKRYVRVVENNSNEIGVQSDAWHRLAKNAVDQDIDGYQMAQNVSWSEVTSHVTEGLSDAKPDIWEGYRASQYPRQAVDDLEWAIKPTSYDEAMPALCVEWKGPGGEMQVAERQCAYDGALMADAAREVHEYLGKSPEVFYRHTQALTVALDGKYVLVHGHHIMPGEASGSLEYHQFSLNEFTPRRSLAEYRALYKYIRNSQDWARERSTERLEELHALAKSRQTAPSAVKGLKSARTGASA
ncbi:hypothetical protein LTS18_002080, partial [Coniosporium uncinatum]